jgi:hydrogenase maturation protease
MTMPAPIVRLLICGTADRGDDGAALTAIARLLPTLEPAVRERLEVRRCEQLDPLDIIDVAAGEACLIVDTVVGIEPGSVIAVPLETLCSRGAAGSPRSSHALPIEQVLGLAAAIRGSLPPGTFVGIGGKWFGFGSRHSRALTAGLAELQAIIEAELERLLAGRGPTGPRLRAARPCRPGARPATIEP